MKISLLSVVTLCIGLSGCGLSGCEKCEGVPSASEAGISIILLNASGTQNLFTPPTNYNQDSVRVSDEQGKELVIAKASAAPGRINFSLFERGKLPALEQPVVRQFLLYLKYSDRDTVRVECELYQPDCTNPDLKKVVIFYNNKKVHEGNSAFIPELIIRKP
jgi:hypothetical protein